MAKVIEMLSVIPILVYSQINRLFGECGSLPALSSQIYGLSSYPNTNALDIRNAGGIPEELEVYT